MGMTAYEMVSRWVYDRSGDLRRHASRADNAYKNDGHLRAYCLAYGKALRAAADAMHATWEREVERIRALPIEGPKP